MEKLLELVMQYEKEVKIPRFRDILPKNIILTKDKKHIKIWGQGYEYFEAYLISKEYGFIKWLVENDKIDLEKCGFDIKNYLSYNKRYDKGIVLAENYDNDTFVVKEFYSPYEQLLMLLSIQDEPINFLISILK